MVFLVTFAQKLRMYYVWCARCYKALGLADSHLLFTKSDLSKNPRSHSLRIMVGRFFDMFLYLPLLFVSTMAMSNISWPPIPGGFPEFRCVSRPSWSTDQFWQNGCPVAWDFARNIEAWQASTKLEFLPNNERPEARRRRRIDTPRRYNRGKLANTHRQRGPYEL